MSASDDAATGREDPARASLHWNLAAGVYRAALARPLAPALVLDGRSWTYAELAGAASGVAARLSRVADAPATRAAAAGRPARVAILASRSFETYAGLLGAAWAGMTYVPLHPHQPPARLATVLARAGLDALIADETGAALLDAGVVKNVLPGDVLQPDDLRRHFGDSFDEPRAVDGTHPAYVLFTSGTTGTPKGVVVPAAAVAHFLSVIDSLYELGPADRFGQVCEPSFDLSVFEIFAAWQAGAALHVVPESARMAPASFIRREQLTVWASVPSVISMLMRMRMLDRGSLPSLRLSFFIGEALSTASARAWQEAAPNSVVDNHYGPTEATVACTMQRCGDPLVETPGRGTVAIGVPYEGMRAEVVDEQGDFLGPGQQGELALSGPQLAQGYLDDPEQTALRFPELHHLLHGRGRWYRSGDLAVRDGQGRLHCLGRLDHQVKILGHRIELEDLEAHLRKASDSADVAAVAWPVVDGNATAVVAFVCGSELSVGQVRERLGRLVPPYMMPRRFRILDALPRTASGKADRRALVAMLESARDAS